MTLPLSAIIRLTNNDPLDKTLLPCYNLITKYERWLSYEEVLLPRTCGKIRGLA